MINSQEIVEVHKGHLVELLNGGFAPNVILLREFDYKKAGIILDGLHFSAWILLGHLHNRHCFFLDWMRDPEKYSELWPPAHWPENYKPKNRREWDSAIDNYERDLKEMTDYISKHETDVFEFFQGGKNISWAAMTVIHHTGYHIGQLKTIGRLLGVW